MIVQFIKSAVEYPSALLRGFVVARAGFEPTYSESKSDILPLDEGTIWSVVGLQSPEAPTLVTPL